MKKQWVGCALSNFRRGRPAGMKPEMIVLHTLKTSLAEADARFARSGALVSAHYAVGRQGEVHQYVEETDTAFHAGLVLDPRTRLVRERPSTNPNFYSIGIEHEGSAEEPWTPVQIATSAALLREISARWGIPLDSDHVLAHSDIRASADCPGLAIRIDALIQMAVTGGGRESATTLPAGPQTTETKQSATDSDGKGDTSLGPTFIKGNEELSKAPIQQRHHSVKNGEGVSTMSELMRFRVARAPQRIITESTSVIEIGPEPPLNDWLQAEDLQAVANEYLTQNDLAPPAATFTINNEPDLSALLAKIRTLDQFLSQHGNRPTVASLKCELDKLKLDEEREITFLNDENLRRCLSTALVASVLGNATPELRVDLTRLMLVIGLIELVLSNKVAASDDIYWALRWRTITFPQRFLERIRSQRSILARRAGFSDLYVVRDEWNRYEAGEIAHIENVLAKESKERKHVRIDETEETFVTETEKSTVNERDSQTTSRFELSQESSQDISLAAHIEGKVDTSGQYGPTHVDTHLGGSLDYSTEQSERRATKQAQETTARAVTRVEEKVREMRTRRTLTRIEETNSHTLKNDTDKPVVGVYRWVDKIQRMQMFRYPNRYLLEFEVPEPGGYRRRLAEVGKNKGIISIEPPPLTTDGKPKSGQNKWLTPADIVTPEEAGAPNDPNKMPSYLEIAARYYTVGLKTPPAEKASVSGSLKQEAGDPAEEKSPTQFYELSAEKALLIPEGYMAIKFDASIMAWSHWSWPLPAWAKGHAEKEADWETKDCILDICIGSKHEHYSVKGRVSELHETLKIELKAEDSDRFITKVPVAVVTDAMRGFTVNIVVTCERRKEILEKWRQEVYEQVVNAYWDMKRQYDEEVAAKSVRQGVLISGDSPARNSEIIHEELKKQAIEMLTAKRFEGRDAIVIENGEPKIDLKKAQSGAPEIQFLEQAFEWENMTYVLYPYFWAGHDRWSDLAGINGADPEFARFLRAGSARLVLPARPGFEAQVQLYTDFGVLWGGGPVPAPGEESYLSVAEEVKAQTQPPKDGIPGESWEVRLPTSLIWLENPAGLPKNPAPKLAPPPGEKKWCICYVIKPGDTLSALALRFYGSADEYMKIFEANRDVIGGDPDKIYAGQVIAIPR